MVENSIPISKFKATCLALLDKVKRTGEPIVVTRRGEPIAIIEPPPPSEKKQMWLGSFKENGNIKGDIITPIGSEETWEILQP